MDETLLDNLIEVLIQELVYYIPSKIVPVDVIDQMNKNNFKGFFDKLLVIDVNKGLLNYETEKFSKLLLEKHTSLEKNIFQLLKKKGELKTYEFDYILNKYFRQVEFYFFITYWLTTNLSLYNKKGIGNTVKGNFHIQYEYYRAHFEDLINQFYTTSKIPKLIESFNLSELIGRYFPDLIARYNAAAKKIKFNENIIIPRTEVDKDIGNKQSVTNIRKPKKIKKDKIITEKIADDFILESVFNLKLNN
jgi:hypothetical protein